MTGKLFPARALLVGLGLAQILATIFVYHSNLTLKALTEALEAAGYLVIPNRQVLETIGHLKPAFYGAFFFTLTLGAGLSWPPLAAVWLTDRLAARFRWLWLVWLVGWVLGVLTVIVLGAGYFLICSVLLIPPLVYYTAGKWRSKKDFEWTWTRTAVFLGPLVLLTALGVTQSNARFYIDVRDFVLLANPVGRYLNNFYYRYTLYPAEAFKSLSQKTLKSSRIKLASDPDLARRVEAILRQADYLPVNRGPFDLEVSTKDQELLFQRHGKTVLTLTKAAFWANPREAFERFSNLTDRYRWLRRVTGWSLMAGLPIALYILLFSLINRLSVYFLSPKWAELLAGGICILAGLSIFVVVWAGRSPDSTGGPFKQLDRPGWRVRVAGLRAIADGPLEIKQYDRYRRFLTSPYIQERYWLGKAIGVSRATETLPDAFQLMADPEPIVVCQAAAALGLRRQVAAQGEIIKLIQSSDHWFIQWYAYRALRETGWVQKVSK